MNIEYIERNYSKIIKITADNVNIEEDVEFREYAKKEDGKIDWTRNVCRDISDEYMNMIARVMSDMAYYRERPYDSSQLIRQLFERLPSEAASELVHRLNKEYNEETN